jgi:hypothetical protein
MVKSKEIINTLLACNADGKDKLPPLVTGKCEKPQCFMYI